MVLSKNKDVPNMEFIALDSIKEKEKTKRHKKKKESDEFDSLKSGVIFLKNIPHGFYEKQMQGYFSQFGDVLQVKLARNKKDGASEGYAYIEFAHEEVAKIAAETMNNYLMFEECLKCEFVPNDKVPEDAFAPNVRYRKPARSQRYFESFKTPLSSEQTEKQKLETDQRLEHLQQQYLKLGISYDWGDLKVDPSFVPPPKRKIPKKTHTDSSKQKKITVKERLVNWIKDFDFYEDENGNCLVKNVPKRKSFSKRKPRSKRFKIEKQTSVHSQSNETSTENEKDLDSDVEQQSRKLTDADDKMKDKNISLNTTPEMIVDLEDDEVTFKTPETVKIKKRVMSTPAGPSEVKTVTPKRRKRLSAVLSAKADRKRKLLMLKAD